MSSIMPAGAALADRACCGSLGSVPGLPAGRPPEPGGRDSFPLGHAVTRAALESDPHPVLARLREHEPVSWLPTLNGWLVTRHDLAARVLRDSAAFTVDDPRFTTARVVGPSMLSLDGPEHTRHRAPFTRGFTRAAVTARLAPAVEPAARALVAQFRPAGRADLRAALAAPLAVAAVADALGLGDTDTATVLSWYLAIVGAVSALTGHAGDKEAATQTAARVSAGEQAFASLGACLRTVLSGGGDCLLAQAAGPMPPGPPPGLPPGTAPGPPPETAPAALPVTAPGPPPATAGGPLTGDEVISNAAVLMFGGIETTEGMISNALLHLLSDTRQLSAVTREPSLIANAVEESLRLEPAAALVDRYATRGVMLGGAAVRRGDLVCVSLAGAGRDPAVFARPEDFDVRRANARLHLAFAAGPHFCLGAQLARLEAQCAVRCVLEMLPGVRLDPAQRAAPQGLVFRKPPSLHARWDPPPR
jgi:cytochrome P450